MTKYRLLVSSVSALGEDELEAIDILEQAGVQYELMEGDYISPSLIDALGLISGLSGIKHHFKGN